MKTRWAIAILGIVALTLVTISVEMPWVFKSHVDMVERPSVSIGTDESHSPMLECPADAKPANLNFTMKDHQGKDVALSSFKGKVLLIDFWATWCGPCKVEIPFFIDFQKKYGSEGLQIVGISVDDTVDLLTPYVANMKMNYPVLLGLGHDDVQEAFGPLVGLPTSVLVSREGKICAVHAGLTGSDVFEGQIKALL